MDILWVAAENRHCAPIRKVTPCVRSAKQRLFCLCFCVRRLLQLSPRAKPKPHVTRRCTLSHVLRRCSLAPICSVQNLSQFSDPCVLRRSRWLGVTVTVRGIWIVRTTKVKCQHLRRPQTLQTRLRALHRSLPLEIVSSNPIRGDALRSSFLWLGIFWVRLDCNVYLRACFE